MGAGPERPSEVRGDLAVFLSAACRGRGDQGAGRAGGPRSPLGEFRVFSRL